MFSAKKLKQRREEMGMSQSRVAQALDISRMSYSNWEAGKTKPNQKNLSALATLFKVIPAYFESEHQIVETYLQLNEGNQIKLEKYADKLLQSQATKVVQLFPIQVLSDLSLSAGPGSSYFDEYETTQVLADQDYKYDIAAWIQGDSMEPKYINGEVALIRETGFDYDGAVYALSWEGKSYIKKIYREEAGFRLVSLNPAYSDLFVPLDDDFRIVGKVIGHFMPIEA